MAKLRKKISLKNKNNLELISNKLKPPFNMCQNPLNNEV